MMAYMLKGLRKDTLPVSLSTQCHARTPTNQKTRKRKVAFRPPLISKPKLPSSSSSSSSQSLLRLSPSTPRSHHRHSLSVHRLLPASPRPRGKGPCAAVALTYLGRSSPREHSCWNFRLSASSTPLVFHSCRTYFT